MMELAAETENRNEKFVMTPLKIGAALGISEIPTFRDWLIADSRDLEIQDFISNNLLLGDWQSAVETARAALDGFEGRLGIHGPFINVPINANDPEIGPIVTRRYLTALEAAEALGATQMVIHSPFTTWDANNFGMKAPDSTDGWTRFAKMEDVRTVMGPVARRAEEIGLTLVIENIEDKDPQDRKDLAESFASPNVKLSIDTGHAHYAHGSTGAPPVDYYVRHAGALLDHVHLQEADGYADRHWAPGRGTINWHAVFGAIAELTVSPHLVLELRDKNDILPGWQWLKDQGLAI